MQQILFHGINVSDFKKLISDILEEKLNSSIKKDPKDNKTEYLTRFEVAEILRISLPTLNNWSKSGILQSYRIGNRILYKANEIEEAIKTVKNLKYRRNA